MFTVLGADCNGSVSLEVYHRYTDANFECRVYTAHEVSSEAIVALIVDTDIDGEDVMVEMSMSLLEDESSRGTSSNLPPDSRLPPHWIILLTTATTLLAIILLLAVVYSVVFLLYANC